MATKKYTPDDFLVALSMRADKYSFTQIGHSIHKSWTGEPCDTDNAAKHIGQRVYNGAVTWMKLDAQEWVAAGKPNEPDGKPEQELNTSDWGDYRVEAEVEPAPLPSSAVPPRKFSFPESPVPTYTKWPLLTDDGEGYVVFGDPHIPAYSKTMMELVMAWGYRCGIKKYIIIGDLVNLDAYSKWNKGMFTEHSVQEECEIAAGFFRALHEWYEGGHVLMGNHDERMTKTLQKHMAASWVFPRLFGVSETVQFTDYGRIDVESGGKAWALLHGANYSAANPLKVVQDYSEKFQANIAMGHQHQSARGMSRCGRFECVSLGGTFDADRLAYLHYQPRKNPVMTTSFGILRDGHMALIDERTPLR